MPARCAVFDPTKDNDEWRSRRKTREIPKHKVSEQRLDGSYKVRLVARGVEQTVNSDADFFAGTPELTTWRGLLTIAALHGNPVAFGD